MISVFFGPFLRKDNDNSRQDDDRKIVGCGGTAGVWGILHREQGVSRRKEETQLAR